MKTQRTGTWRHTAFILGAVGIAAAALILALVGRPLPDRVVVAAHGLLLILVPVGVCASIAGVARGLRALRRAADARHAARNPQASGPPIERIAADLRRLLWQHDRLSRSSLLIHHARRLSVLEAAITESAVQAARALEVPHPDRPPWGGYDRPQLRRLLRALAAEGLVLPQAVELLAPGG